MVERRRKALARAAVKLAEEINASAIVAPDFIELDSKIPVIRFPLSKLDRVEQIENAAILAYLEGRIGGSTVVGITGFHELDSIIVLDLRESLFREFADRVPTTVLRAVLDIVLGLKNKRIGTAFIIGDTENVLRRSHQLILNPFEGHQSGVRDVKKEDNWETIKKFAQLDGDFVVDREGMIITAGRYIDSISKDVKVQPGLGGRHISAASITGDTKAVAITLSKSGAVRMYKDGKLVVEL